MLGKAEGTLALTAWPTLPAAAWRSAAEEPAARAVSTLLAMASSSGVMARFMADRFLGTTGGGLSFTLGGLAAGLLASAAGAPLLGMKLDASGFICTSCAVWSGRVGDAGNVWRCVWSCKRDGWHHGNDCSRSHRALGNNRSCSSADNMILLVYDRGLSIDG